MSRFFNKIFLVICLFLISLSVSAYPEVPNKRLTPGDLCSTKDRDFSGFRYRESIPYCRRAVSYTVKERVYNEYDIPRSERWNYTIDHFIPLAVGGSNHISNLWPEHKNIKRARQSLEYSIYLDLKYGRMTQEQAIKKIIYHKRYNVPFLKIKG